MIYRPCPPRELPLRKRSRTILKEKRFGGECQFEMMTRVGEDGIIYQDERCPLCHQHCPQELSKHNQPIDWGLVPYRDNQACVGYCPIDCKWGERTVKNDCKAQQEEYFDSVREEREENHSEWEWKGPENCYLSDALATLGDNELFDMAEQYWIELTTKLEEMKKCNCEDSWPLTTYDIKVLKKFEKENRRERDMRKLVRIINRHAQNDLEKLNELTRNEVKREAEVPVLDGLFGGKPCIRTDGRTLTIRSSIDEKFNRSSQYNRNSWDEINNFGYCPLVMCYPCAKNKAEGGRDLLKKECLGRFIWSTWGEWGACDSICAETGRRTRKRKCQSICSNDEQDVSKCEKWYNNVLKKTVDGAIDKTKCEPCPTEVQPAWSEWGPWSNVDWIREADKDVCSSEDYYTMTRKRECILPNRGTTMSCGGDSTERREIPKPRCETDGGMEFTIVKEVVAGNGIDINLSMEEVASGSADGDSNIEFY